MSGIELYSFWRSQATYRVRIAMFLKGIEADIRSIDLLKGEQHADNFRALNSEGLVPALVEAGQSPLTQSLAILEYLEETHPDPPILPREPRDRAYVRALAQLPAMDAHPLVVPRVRVYLEKMLGVDEAKRNAWLKHWMEEGNKALEALLAKSGKTGKYSLGDRVTIADICLVPHVTTARMLYDCDVRAYPNIARIAEACMALDAFSATHPLEQPGAGAAH
jgi:maleylacetoacetate isomerase/maleylpyruvate isomerase